MTAKMRAPLNVGIIAAEFYTPQYYVEQAELEKHDCVSEGKYTHGLLQDQLGFCMTDEDVNSLCLTVVDRLLTRLDIDRAKIGRIDVGSESHVDRAKSIKSVLMRLFYPLTDINGSDHMSACFGGTAALFSAINWIESSFWDGRFALVVAGDVAVYDLGPARPTSGAGAVAMLVGPNAKILIDGPPSFFSSDIYDFYKANMASEFPAVDGQLSINSYLQALEHCYEKMNRPSCDYLCMHTPYAKLAVKAAKLLDELNPKILQSSVNPSLYLTKKVGNMYCASIFAGLLSILLTTICTESESTVLMYSYGSGCTAALFTMRLLPDCEDVIDSSSIISMLEKRQKVSPSEFNHAINQRSTLFLEKSWTPSPIVGRQSGVWYLVNVDELHRRHYEKS